MLPVDDDPGKEVAAGGRVLFELFVAARAVEADGGLRDERARTVPGRKRHQSLHERARRRDTGLADGLLGLVRPPLRDLLAEQVHDRIRAGERGLGRGPVGRPGQAYASTRSRNASRARSALRESTDDVLLSRQQGAHDGAADGAGGAGDDDSHRSKIAGCDASRADSPDRCPTTRSSRTPPGRTEPASTRRSARQPTRNTPTVSQETSRRHAPPGRRRAAPRARRSSPRRGRPRGTSSRSSAGARPCIRAPPRRRDARRRSRSRPGTCHTTSSSRQVPNRVHGHRTGVHPGLLGIETPHDRQRVRRARRRPELDNGRQRLVPRARRPEPRPVQRHARAAHRNRRWRRQARPPHPRVLGHPRHRDVGQERPRLRARTSRRLRARATAPTGRAASTPSGSSQPHRQHPGPPRRQPHRLAERGVRDGLARHDAARGRDRIDLATPGASRGSTASRGGPRPGRDAARGPRADAARPPPGQRCRARHAGSSSATNSRARPPRSPPSRPAAPASGPRRPSPRRAVAAAGASRPSSSGRGCPTGPRAAAVRRVIRAPSREHTEKQTVPTGFSSVPPPGPAIPVIPIPISAPNRGRRPGGQRLGDLGRHRAEALDQIRIDPGQRRPWPRWSRRPPRPRSTSEEPGALGQPRRHQAARARLGDRDRPPGRAATRPARRPSSRPRRTAARVALAHELDERLVRRLAPPARTASRPRSRRAAGRS